MRRAGVFTPTGSVPQLVFPFIRHSGLQKKLNRASSPARKRPTLPPDALLSLGLQLRSLNYAPGRTRTCVDQWSGDLQSPVIAAIRPAQQEDTSRFSPQKQKLVPTTSLPPPVPPQSHFSQPFRCHFGFPFPSSLQSGRHHSS